MLIFETIIINISKMSVWITCSMSIKVQNHKNKDDLSKTVLDDNKYKNDQNVKQHYLINK